MMIHTHSYAEMVVMDGRTLAEENLRALEAEYAALPSSPTLAIVRVGNDPVIERFVQQKKKIAERLGVRVIERVFGAELSRTVIRERIGALAHDRTVDGIIVQLPLPQRLNVQDVLNAITPEKDVDLLSARSVGNFASGKTTLTPPVVGAVIALAERYAIDLRKKQIAVVGGGRLVGQPITAWLLHQHIGYTVVTETTPHPEEIFRRADIIITGVGKRIIDSSMVKDGVVVFDAGTSESEGVVQGDVDYDSVAKKASAISPVPGGIGPLTVVWIFKNLLSLIKLH